MTVLLMFLALIVVAALALAVALLRSEPLSQQGFAALNQSQAIGRDYDRALFLCAENLSGDQREQMREQLKRLREDFLTAWAVCRLLGPVCQEPDTGQGLVRCWCDFHCLFASVWLKTYGGSHARAAGQVDSLLAVVNGLRRRAATLMQLDAGRRLA